MQPLLPEQPADSSIAEWVAALPRMLSAPCGHADLLSQIIEVALSDAVPPSLVEKMLQAVARFAPQNDATASALLTLLECHVHPLPVIHALGSICVACSESVVSRALLLLQSCASADRSLVVAALGAMAAMPLKDQMKRVAFDTAAASLAYISDADAPSVSRSVLTACSGNSSSGSSSLQSQAVTCVRAVCSSIGQQHASLVHEEMAAAAKADAKTWKALLAAINAAHPWAPFDAALALLLLPCRRFRPAITASIHRALQSSAISPELFAPNFAGTAVAVGDRSSCAGGSFSRSSGGGGALLLVDALLRSPTLPQPMEWMECVIVPLIRRSHCSSEVAVQLVITGAAAAAAAAAARILYLTLSSQRCRPPCTVTGKLELAGAVVEFLHLTERRTCCSISLCSTAKRCRCTRCPCCKTRSSATTSHQRERALAAGTSARSVTRDKHTHHAGHSHHYRSLLRHHRCHILFCR